MKARPRRALAAPWTGLDRRSYRTRVGPGSSVEAGQPSELALAQTAPITNSPDQVRQLQEVVVGRLASMLGHRSRMLQRLVILVCVARSVDSHLPCGQRHISLTGPRESRGLRSERANVLTPQASQLAGRAAIEHDSTALTNRVRYTTTEFRQAIERQLVFATFDRHTSPAATSPPSRGASRSDRRRVPTHAQ
jgi:hypothetical protein